MKARGFLWGIDLKAEFAIFEVMGGMLITKRRCMEIIVGTNGNGYVEERNLTLCES
jgi:hypothetical protein